MSTVFNDHSSNTSREVRNVTATATTTVVANFYKAKSLWTSGGTVPPQDGTNTTWVFAAA